MENWTNLQLLMPALLGALLNFIMEYNAKRKTGFSIKFWISDNWLNIIGLYLMVVLLGYVGVPALNNAIAMAALGFALNKIFDYIQDFFSKEHA